MATQGEQWTASETADHDYKSKLSFHSKGWQAASIEDNARFDSPTGRNFVQLAKMDESGVRINCYMPGQSDDALPSRARSIPSWCGRASCI